ncbi:hypothetical protein SELMODRAFT_440209 [Selaginella moellendorffii]|uniref:CID domain-containing protein n=1 Tax=Selaginella moellendorffii TaxID=88036 RepID=D8R983_SELML|nr:regulation of nuclear pre-mRNA domain-containing protein 1A [Selaginella moellendorffii]XP_024528701.1 regulation of nuclear pre-mRNA domain-containing protein 1A [Selaginella moellendorffii]XP_024528702.1 regulation of nuclear pre-mRNA domain-containing protein 1A [Selaginella moellendorffii]EFJ31370.1 hypothetical protein SELMODRAFT_440209 [Selaginella moellendorffii]|eukprot:XP_002968023.1 regulation of nuclear pre-mRNA domain-containing protein 1A [Selaginella moellendorffii]
MTGAFSVEVLSEKLIKLNASQQSIETLSHWCIYHRKRAKQIAKTWEKEFFSAPKEKRVSFLYLANDIIQNSRRKGSEFVSEFWKVLNGALKDVKANGDENGRTAVSRLVNIWEERKVFGSRAQSLKETLLGNNPVPDFEIPDKEKEKGKDKPTTSSSFIKIKLDGSILEKVAKAFQDVNDGLSNEEATIEECNSIKRRIEALGKEAASHGQENENSTVRDELQQQRGNLSQLVEQLETIERSRSKLVTYLREALEDQERKLELVRCQIEEFSSPAKPVTRTQALPSVTPSPLPPVVQSMASIDDGSKKVKETPTAAEVAAKLAASSSSAAMLSSIFSSLTPEEFGFQPDNKRPKLVDSSSGGGTNQGLAQQFIHPAFSQAPPPQAQAFHSQAPPQPQAQVLHSQAPPPPQAQVLHSSFQPQHSQFLSTANLRMPYPYPGMGQPPPPPPPPQQPPPQLPPLPPGPPLPPVCAPAPSYHSLQIPPGINFYPPAPQVPR